MVDRRTLLLAGAAGALLPGCGSDSGTATGAPAPDRDALTPTEIAGDVELLNGMLELELQSVSLYRGLRGRAKLIANLLDHERRHVEQLRRAIRELGGTPVERAGAEPGARAPLELARRVEETAIAACLDAMPKLSSPQAREFVASIAATEAAHLAAVELALGGPASTAAFVTAERRL